MRTPTPAPTAKVTAGTLAGATYALLMVASAFGFPITQEQREALLTLAAMLSPLVYGAAAYLKRPAERDGPVT